MEYKKTSKYRINRATKKYARVRPVRKDSLDYEIALQRIVTKLNNGRIPRGFNTAGDYLDWLSKQPNYVIVDLGLDYRLGSCL